MISIYKYPVPVQDKFGLELPHGAAILCIQTQNGLPYIWTKIDTTKEYLEIRKFNLYGTGHDIRSQFEEYIGTFQMYEGEFVFHLFEDLTYQGSN